MRDGSDEKKIKELKTSQKTFAVEEDCRPKVKILKSKYFFKVHI